MDKAAVFDQVQAYARDIRPTFFSPGKTYIPVASQTMGVAEMLTLVDVALDLKLSSGRKTTQFEQALAPYFGQKISALMVNSGSSANLIAISALGLKPGDEVITAACGFPTTVNPIVQCGAVPVFVDVNFEMLNVDIESIKNAKTSKTKAVVLAHTLGNPFRADLLAEWCDEHDIQLVEDCCDALGSRINGTPVGSFGDYATCSFYPAHHISTGEGGAVIASTGRGRKTCESLRDWGRDCWCEPANDNTCGKRFCQQFAGLPAGYDHKYTYSRLGYNLKATELQSAVGLEQLAKVDRFIQARKDNWKHLNYAINKNVRLWEYLTPVQATPETQPSWFGFPMHLRHDLSRSKLMAFLEERKVGSRLVFAGNLTKQPAYKGVNYRVHGELTNTDRVMNQTFWLGVHPGLDDVRIAYMLEQLEAGIKAQL